MLVPGVNSNTNTDSRRDGRFELTWKTKCSIMLQDTHIHAECHDRKMHTLTFDPVSLIEADFSLSLGRVWSSRYKDSSWDSTVEASPLACGLSSCAGRGRPGWGAEGGVDDLRPQVKTQKAPYGWLNYWMQYLLCFLLFLREREKGKVSVKLATSDWKCEDF